MPNNATADVLSLITISLRRKHSDYTNEQNRDYYEELVVKLTEELNILTKNKNDSDFILNYDIKKDELQRAQQNFDKYEALAATEIKEEKKEAASYGKDINSITKNLKSISLKPKLTSRSGQAKASGFDGFPPSMFGYLPTIARFDPTENSKLHTLLNQLFKHGVKLNHVV